MPAPLWSRVRKGRLIQVLLVYLGASWAVLQGVDLLRDTFQLPRWVGPTAFILLAIGLVMMLATAWVQSHPLVERREAKEEVPGSWELDLRQLRESVAQGQVPHLTWARALLGGVFAFSLLFGLAGVYVVVKDRGRSFAPEEAVAEEAAHGIAVLPFSVRGAPAEWRDGMVDLLSTGLDGAGGLRAIDARTVLARWDEVIGAGEARTDERTALEVARQTGATYALLGSAVAVGPEVRLVADVHGLDGDRRLGQAQVEGPPDSVLALVDRLAMQALGVILGKGEGDVPRVDLASVTTSSLPALKAYLEGEALFRRGEFAVAAEAYERAVSLDSTFALAHYGLKETYGWEEGGGSRRRQESLDRALALTDRLPERHRALLQADRLAGAPGVAHLEEMTRKYPDDAEAWYQLGDAYYHVRAVPATTQDIEEALLRAVRLAPGLGPYRIHLLDLALQHHADSSLAYQRLEEYEHVSPSSAEARERRAAADIAFGDSASRAAALAAVAGMSGPELAGVTIGLFHPRFQELEELLLQQRYRTGTREERTLARFWLILGAVTDRGRLRWALAELEDPEVQAVTRRNLPYFFHSLGLPVPGERVDAAVSPWGPDSLDVAGAFVVGAWAADRGRWETHAAAVARLRLLADSLRAGGSAVAAEEAGRRVRSVESYAAWRRGRPEEAIRGLETAMPDGSPPLPPYWLAELYRETGRLADAARQYVSLNRWAPVPLVAYRLGQVYEELGEPAKARAEYELFVTSWADADPELQPMVEDARARLLRLMDDIGG